MRRHLVAVTLFVLALVCVSAPAGAVFHLAVIDEVMTSYGGNPNVQFIEIRMLGTLQNFVFNSVLAAFDANGNYINDILVVPANVTNSGNGVRWLVGTAAFQTATGLTPDFPMPAGILPTGGGMVCFGGGGGIAPAPPNSWSRTDFPSYVDCVAYGSYSGPTNVHTGNPTPIAPDGHSIQRIHQTNDNKNDFACGNPADPTTNAPASASMSATAPCPAAGLDHFKCYKIKKDTLVNPEAAATVDQFSNETVSIKKAFLWCNPVSKDGGAIIDATDHLLCYKIKGAKLDPAPHIASTNQYGLQTLFAKKPFLLCVPGSKVIIP